MTAETLATQLNVKRSELMTSELEAVALRLFEAHGFDEVTVEEIASAARISVRTFYRYFPAKEAVLQVQIDRRSDALRTALAARPVDEAPLPALRFALEEAVAHEDMVVLRRWNTVVANTPSVLKGVLGGLQLKRNGVIAEFIGARFGMPSSSVVPTMLAAATGGVIQAAQTQWLFEGGDLPALIAEGLEVLERGFGAAPPS